MWRDVPLGAVMKAIRTGEVRLDGKKTKGDVRLSEGQILTVPWNDAEYSGRRTAMENELPKQSTKKTPSLSTLYKDDYVWIVNKPAGLLVQPDKAGGDSLIARALAELNWTRRDFCPATVQRLDRNTSGAVMIAMTGAAQRHLAELIRDRAIRKIYIAEVHGITDDGGRIDIPLSKDAGINKVRPDSEGMPALTIYKRTAVRGDKSLIEAELVTGRPHQARAHLAAIGHPIVGDIKYGGKGAKRPLLHAYALIFPDDPTLPKELQCRTITAPVPHDLQKYAKDVNGR